MAFTTSLSDAEDPLVLGLDVGSTATRGSLFDAAGRPIALHRYKIPHAFTTAADGTSTIDADQVVDEIAAIVQHLATPELTGRIAGVGLDTFASSVVGVDASGTAITPTYTYADSRCSRQVTELRLALDEAAVQQRTGARLHTSYLAPRLRWLAQTEPTTFAAVRSWLSIGEYAYLRLLGTAAAGTSTAAWTGLLNRFTGDWDDEMLAAACISAATLSPVHDPDQALLPRPGSPASGWSTVAKIPWFPPVSDGIASNLGAGATDASTIVAAAATSGALRVLVHDLPEQLPAGLWCYRIDRHRSLLGGALNDVGRAISWLQTVLQLPESSELDQALIAEPDSTTPLVLPYFSGERSTGWAANARAHLGGISAATTPAALFRGTFEGIALAYGRVANQLRDVTGQTRRILASGRITADWPSWLQILADVLDAPVTPIVIKRSTLHGTALLALETVAPDVRREPPTEGTTRVPVSTRQDYYGKQAALFQRTYECVIR